jgi:hypothetical protein
MTERNKSDDRLDAYFESIGMPSLSIRMSAIAAPKPSYAPSRLAGRCANGNELGRGYIYHAVTRGSWAALCGKIPGRLSGGWSENHEAAVNCPKCLNALKDSTKGEQ